MGRPVEIVSSGVVGVVGSESELLSTELVAVTVQVYATLLVNPEIVIRVEVLVPVKVLAPSVQVAV